jgi:hypothetical protein
VKTKFIELRKDILMFKIFKSREAKAVFSGTIAFLLVFSMMAASVAAVTPAVEMPEIEYATTVSAEALVADVDMRHRVLSGDFGGGSPELDDGLAEAISAVKRYFSIDEKRFTQFNWHYWPGDGFYSPDSWYLSWNSNDWNAQISAQITSGGILLHYYRYEWSPDFNARNIKLAEITKAAAERRANTFMRRVLGDDASRYRLSEHHLGFPSDRHNLNYVLTHEGYDHPNYNISVSIDKMTGEIVGFGRGGHMFFHDLSEDILEYQDSSATISQEQAMQAYLEHIGLELVYTSWYDWQTRRINVRPVYRLKNNWDQFISAVDGSLVTIDFNIHPVGAAPMTGGAMSNVAMESSANDGAARVSFSGVEQAAIDSAGDFITADEAVRAVIKAFDLGIDDLSGYSVSTHLNSDHINRNQYIWNVSLSGWSEARSEWYSGSVDARNGNIIHFWQSVSEHTFFDDGSGRMMRGFVEPEFIYTYEQAKEIVLSKVKELSPHDLDENFEFIDGSNNRSPIMPLDAKSSHYGFTFVRKVNGIQFADNAIYVGFNNMSGKIESYSFTWYEDARFPRLSGVITPEAALASIVDFSDYTIRYMSNGMTEGGKINVSLIYSFNYFVMVDPFTGGWLNWNFDEMAKGDASLPDYQDLDGHWSKDIVNTLADNGIYVWGGDAFEPDKYITRGEFLNYLRFYTHSSWMFTSLDSSIFINPHAYNLNNIADPNAGNIITKQEMAKIICEVAGYGELAKHHRIFVYPFDEDESDAAYRGYITILKAFGIIEGDSFDAKANLTRAEAASIIYNIIMSFQ